MGNDWYPGIFILFVIPVLTDLVWVTELILPVLIILVLAALIFGVFSVISETNLLLYIFLDIMLAKWISGPLAGSSCLYKIF